jgi:hypothetical protein
VVKQREEVDKEAHNADSVDFLICACDPRIAREDPIDSRDDDLRAKIVRI